MRSRYLCGVDPLQGRTPEHAARNEAVGVLSVLVFVAVCVAAGVVCCILAMGGAR